jgi:hypothetical protein
MSREWRTLVLEIQGETEDIELPEEVKPHFETVERADEYVYILAKTLWDEKETRGSAQRLLDLMLSRNRTDHSPEKTDHSLENVAALCISELEECSRAATVSISSEFEGLYVLYVQEDGDIEREDSYSDRDVRASNRFGGVFGETEERTAGEYFREEHDFELEYWETGGLTLEND